LLEDEVWSEEEFNEINDEDDGGVEWDEEE
jgi:hypothetical protein